MCIRDRDAVLGTNLGPRSNNSVLALLHRMSGQALDVTNRPWLPEGGMGAVTDALAAAARALLTLLGARHLDTGFAQRIRHLRSRGTAAKLHLALDDLPEFARLPPILAGERLVIAPDHGYLEHAFDASKYG